MVTLTGLIPRFGGHKNGHSMHAGLVDVPLLSDPLGSIGVVEGRSLIPFEVKRFYFIRDVPRGATRGSHAHKNLHQLVIAVNGSVTVDLDDGIATESFDLLGPNIGLHVPPGYWRTLRDFAPDTVVASTEYAESDYIRDYDAFLVWKNRD
jgi:dTDP-4-dehydrorhamnose 3,5-epimerase-like enzyme